MQVFHSISGWVVLFRDAGSHVISDHGDTQHDLGNREKQKEREEREKKEREERERRKREKKERDIERHQHDINMTST